MPKQNKITQCSIKIPNNSVIDWIIGSVADAGVDANATDPQPLSAAKIPRVPSMMSEKPDYEKYFVPQAVSIGPYHFGELKLQMLEKRKPEFAMKLFSNDKEALTSLYEKLGDPEMVKDLRSFYEEGSTTKYCDKHFDFSKGWCGFSIAVQLPPMDVTGYTKPILINLIAYEMYSGEDDWVTSYVCLLHSLIGDHEDVKVLTKAGVLENWLGTDSEVVELFREGPNYLHTQFAYLHT
ncbi:hypothetical protein HanOQP8_Chr13g0471051 [Helianthus annuus]|nr:hypothetical protein HanOQP8_Chr13g0471051 [Helianthus annuus]